MHVLRIGQSEQACMRTTGGGGLHEQMLTQLPPSREQNWPPQFNPWLVSVVQHWLVLLMQMPGLKPHRSNPAQTLARSLSSVRCIQSGERRNK